MARMSRSRKRQHGQALIMFVLALVVILAFTSIVIDLGLLRTNTARLQNALDAGALAGAQQLVSQQRWQQASLAFNRSRR